MLRRTVCTPLSLLSLVLIGVSGAAGAQSLNKENFHEYLAALENVDAQALTNRFYHESFTIQLGEETMDVAGLLEYENYFKSLVDFHFETTQIVADESGIAVDAIEKVYVRQDAEVPNIGPAREGDEFELHLNVFYELTDGKISSIRANVLSAQKIE